MYRGARFRCRVLVPREHSRISLCEPFITVLYDLFSHRPSFVVIGTWNIGNCVCEGSASLSLVEAVLSACSRARGCVIIYGCCYRAEDRAIATQLAHRFKIPIIRHPKHHAKYVITEYGLYLGSANLSDSALVGQNIEIHNLVIGPLTRHYARHLLENVIPILFEFLREVRDHEWSRIMTKLEASEELAKILQEKLEWVVESLENLRKRLGSGLERSHGSAQEDPPMDIHDAVKLVETARELCYEPLNAVGSATRFLLNFPGLKTVPPDVHELVDELLRVEQICDNILPALINEEVRRRILEQIEQCITTLREYARNIEYLKKIVQSILQEVDEVTAREQMYKLMNVIEFLSEFK